MLCITMTFQLSAQKSRRQKKAPPIPVQRTTDDEDDAQKHIYNYSYCSYYGDNIGSPKTNYIVSFSTVTYIANGRQQFGIGTGILSHFAKSDSGKMHFMSVPIFLSNKFFLTQNEDNGGVYLDFQAGFNLPVSATYESGDKAGMPIAPDKIKSTGIYGLSIGTRMTSHSSKNISFIAEIGYRNQHLPYIADKKSYSSNLFGVSLGLSF